MTEVYTSLFQGLLFWPQAIKANEKPLFDIIENKIDIIISTFINTYGKK